MLFFGANDACLPGTSTGQHVPIDRYIKNLKELIAHPSIKEHEPRLILVTPPPVDEYQLEESGPGSDSHEIQRTAEHTKRYADACREVGTDLDVAVVDLWSIFMAKAGWKHGQSLIGSKGVERSKVLGSLLSDGKFEIGSPTIKLIKFPGLHFNPDGYKLLFDATMSTIKQRWPDQDSDVLPFVSPTWQIALRS